MISSGARQQQETCVHTSDMTCFQQLAAHLRTAAANIGKEFLIRHPTNSTFWKSKMKQMQKKMKKQKSRGLTPAHDDEEAMDDSYDFAEHF